MSFFIDEPLSTETDFQPKKKIKDKKFTLLDTLKDGKSSVYSLSFNHLDDRFKHQFVAANENRLFIYQVQNNSIKRITRVIDCDKEEIYYSVVWGKDLNGNPIFLAGGTRGILKIFSCTEPTKMVRAFGHGKAIYSIRVHPTNPLFVLTASADLTIKLWNLKTLKIVAIFAGIKGHQSGVLSIDIHSSGKYFVSSGLDNAIKIWEITDEMLKSDGKKPIEAHFPIISSIYIFRNYVDCIQFMGDFVIAKSVRLGEDKLETGERLLVFSLDFKENKFDIVKTLITPVTDFWFLRFDIYENFISFPYTDGSIHIFEYPNERPIEVLKERIHKKELIIRETSWSKDGKYLIAGDDEAKIYLWKKEE